MVAKQKVRIRCYSEDFAGVYEAVSVDSGEVVDSLYTGATDWEVNRAGTLKRVQEWEAKFDVVN